MFPLNLSKYPKFFNQYFHTQNIKVICVYLILISSNTLFNLKTTFAENSTSFSASKAFNCTNLSENVDVKIKDSKSKNYPTNTSKSPTGSSKTFDDTISKIQSVYEKVGFLQADFNQDSYLASLDVSESSHGKMWFQKPGKMKWHYLEPDEQFFIINENKLTFYQVVDKQATIDNFDKVLLTELPVAFLMGIGDIKKQFNVQDICNGSSGLIISLSPITPNKISKTKMSNFKDFDGNRVADDKDNSKENPVKSFKLLVDEKSFVPLGADIQDISGNKTSIVF